MKEELLVTSYLMMPLKIYLKKKMLLIFQQMTILKDYFCLWHELLLMVEQNTMLQNSLKMKMTKEIQ
eukprot:10262218-Ditylum_brightwellii.AAC.1